MADCLATRDPQYAQGLGDEARALFDPDGQRKNYTTLQEILVDLRLRERAELGRALHTVSDRVSGQAQGIALQAAHFDGRDWVFLFVASKKCDKSILFRIVQGLSGAALAHYKKTIASSSLIARGEHYDLALSRPGYQPTAEDTAITEKHFGPLLMSTVDISQL